MTLPIDGAQVQGYLTSTNADCFSFSVCDRSGDNGSTAFVQFVRFLDLTQNFTVRGRQLRVVSATPCLILPRTARLTVCATRSCFTCHTNTMRQALVLDPPTEATEGSGCGKLQNHLQFSAPFDLA